MTVSVVFWCVIAVLAFWAIGAYNRLMRLRYQVGIAFAPVDEQFRQAIALVAETLPDAELPLAAGLRGAADQFEACLKAARARPLFAPAMAALQTARQTLNMTWARLQECPHDLAGSPVPESLNMRWNLIATTADIASQEFNRKVQAYNDAIRQFPAVLLAMLFGFQAAGPL
jgi:LemA protein